MFFWKTHYFFNSNWRPQNKIRLFHVFVTRKTKNKITKIVVNIFEIIFPENIYFQSRFIKNIMLLKAEREWDALRDRINRNKLSSVFLRQEIWVKFLQKWWLDFLCLYPSVHKSTLVGKSWRGLGVLWVVGPWCCEEIERRGSIHIFGFYFYCTLLPVPYPSMNLSITVTPYFN